MLYIHGDVSSMFLLFRLSSKPSKGEKKATTLETAGVYFYIRRFKELVILKTKADPINRIKPIYT